MADEFERLVEGIVRDLRYGAEGDIDLDASMDALAGLPADLAHDRTAEAFGRGKAEAGLGGSSGRNRAAAVGRHHRAEIGSVLTVEGLTQFDTRDLGNRVGLIAGLQVAGQQFVFTDQLVGQARVDWENRGHFFAIAARAARRLLVDHARARLRAKRGGGAVKVSLTASLPVADDDQAAEIMAIDDERMRAFVAADELALYAILLERMLRYKPHTLSAGDTLTLRYRLMVHHDRGDPKTLDREYKDFASSP